MTNLLFLQITLTVIAICGIAFFYNRKWWFIGAVLPIALYYIQQYFPDVLPIRLTSYFVVPAAIRDTSSVTRHLLTLEAPTWSICAGMSTLILAHISTESIKSKLFALVVCFAPLFGLLWIFRFLLLKGLDAI